MSHRVDDPAPESGQLVLETHGRDADLIGAIREEHRVREDYRREAQSLQNRQCAIVRRLTQCEKAAAPKILKKVFDHSKSETQLQCVDSNGNGHPNNDTQEDCAAILALCLPFRECQDLLLKQQKLQEKKLKALAKQLPVWSWVETVRGVGPLSLAQMIGELGDLSGYSNPAKPWKRMGLGLVSYPCPKCHKEEFEKFVAAIKDGLSSIETHGTCAKDPDQNSGETQPHRVTHPDQGPDETQPVSVPNPDQHERETQKNSVANPGQASVETQTEHACKKCAGKGFIQEAQRKCTDKKLALLHGYNPKRRSIMWNVGVCLIKQNDGKYRQMYDDQKSYQLQVNELTKLHAHRRAQRYMEKALLRDLWIEWNHCANETQNRRVPLEAA